MSRWVTCLIVTILPTVVAAQPWADDFDAYAAGTIDGQGGWQGWNNDAGSSVADVSGEQASSPPHSLKLRPGSDLVRSYAGANSGMWAFRGEIFIPSGHTGETYFILLNTYSHGGAQNWSTQLRWNSSSVASLGGSGFGGVGDNAAVTITDEWVSFEVLIDFDANTQVISYNGVVIDTTVWHATGSLNMETVDLFSNNGSAAYFDNLSLEPVGGPGVPTLSVGGSALLGLLLLTAGVVVTLTVRRRKLASA